MRVALFHYKNEDKTFSLYRDDGYEIFVRTREMAYQAAVPTSGMLSFIKNTIDSVMNESITDMTFMLGNKTEGLYVEFVIPGDVMPDLINAVVYDYYSQHGLLQSARGINEQNNTDTRMEITTDTKTRLVS